MNEDKILRNDDNHKDEWKGRIEEEAPPGSYVISEESKQHDTLSPRTNTPDKEPIVGRHKF